MSSYVDDHVEPISLKESVRKRPFMYMGKDGVVGFFADLINDYIRFLKTDEVIFTFSIIGENQFSLSLSSSFNLKSTLHPFHTDETRDDNIRLKLLKLISDKFELKNVDKNNLLINFSIDRTVICDTLIDYQELCEKAIQIAVLNRRAEIIIKDLRQKIPSQNYYHFPQGVFYLFDRLIKNALGKPVFKITFDGMIQNNYYQIGIAYRTDWYPSPAIVSFANEINTVCGGSLVDGVISGLVSSCKMYVKNNDLKNFKIKRQRFFNGLIIVCAVKGEAFNYGGNFRETLEDNEVKKQSAKMVSKLVYNYLGQNKEVAESFLFRFDESQLVSKMYYS